MGDGFKALKEDDAEGLIKIISYGLFISVIRLTAVGPGGEIQTFSTVPFDEFSKPKSAPLPIALSVTIFVILKIDPTGM